MGIPSRNVAGRRIYHHIAAVASTLMGWVQDPNRNAHIQIQMTTQTHHFVKLWAWKKYGSSQNMWAWRAWRKWTESGRPDSCDKSGRAARSNLQRRCVIELVHVSCGPHTKHTALIFKYSMLWACSFQTIQLDSSVVTRFDAVENVVTSMILIAAVVDGHWLNMYGCVCVCIYVMSNYVVWHSRSLFVWVKEKEEGYVQLNDMMALVSCPQYDWKCSTCVTFFNEVDKDRKWVDPRPCAKCQKPLETCRTRESMCPIFKLKGSTPSPREMEVHLRT